MTLYTNLCVHRRTCRHQPCDGLRKLIFFTSILVGVHGALQFGIQSDDGDVASSYATDMYYDASIERLYITGASYGNFFDPSYPYDTKISDSDCFVGVVQLPRVSDARGPVWLRRKSYGSISSTEVCSALHVQAAMPGVVSSTNKRIHLAGHSLDYPQMFDPHIRAEQEPYEGHISAYGIVMNVEEAGLELSAGYILQSSAMQYTVAITGSDEDNDIFVVAVETNDEFKGSAYEDYLMDQFTLQPDPALLGSFFPPRVGDGFTAYLARVGPLGEGTTGSITLVDGTTMTSNQSSASQSQPDPTRWTPRWSAGFTPRSSDNVYVSSLIKKESQSIFVAGFNSTINGGERYTDSFIVSVDPQSGKTLQSKRLRSKSGSIYMVFDLCTATGGSSSIFAVGIQDDDASAPGSYRAVLMKLDTQSLEIQWEKQIRALSTKSEKAQIYGLSCAVSSDNEVVYVAGTVKNGATITLDGSYAVTKSAGKDDIFIAQWKVDNGDIMYVKQVGTSHDDRLATGTGVISDVDGNALVLANTKGSFMREKNRLGEGITSDIIIFSIDRETGNHKEVAESRVSDEVPVENNLNTDPPKQESEDNNLDNLVDPSPTRAPIHATPVSDKPGLMGKPKNTEKDAESDGADETRTGLLVVIAFLLNIMFVSCVLIFCLRFKQYKKRHETKVATGEEKEDTTFVLTTGSLMGMNVTMRPDPTAEQLYLEDESVATIRGLHPDDSVYEDAFLRLEPSGTNSSRDDCYTSSSSYSSESSEGQEISAFGGKSIKSIEANNILERSRRQRRNRGRLRGGRDGKFSKGIQS